jgi:hypothetical protein
MSNIQFNLNNQIKVKLTKTGKKYLKQKNIKLTTDEEGFLTLPLWEFAGIFGDALLPTLDPPVEPNIILIVDRQLTSKSSNEQPVEIGSIAICAIRYAISINAQEQVKYDCITGIKSYWNIISLKDQAVIAKDLKKTIGTIPEMGFRSNWHEFHQWIRNFQQQHATVEEVTFLGKLTLFAIRYCIGRKTYMPSLIADATRDNWHFLSEDDRAAIKSEVQLAINTRYLGMDCDCQTWESFNYWIDANI